MSKHTPKPWRIHPEADTIVEASDYVTISQAWDFEINPLPDNEIDAEGTANALLISLSPEMFDFISEFVEAIDEGLIVIDDTDAGVWTSSGYRFYRLGKQILDKVNNGVVKESV